MSVTPCFVTSVVNWMVGLIGPAPSRTTRKLTGNLKMLVLLIGHYCAM